MKKLLKSLLTMVGTMVMGMYGGQKKKGVRRFGIPGAAFIGALGDGFDWKDLSFLLLVPVLAMGYGENSFLMGILGQDWLVRIVYGGLLSMPFFFFGWRRGLFAAAVLPVAFLIRAGSFGHIDWFGDLLIEDAIRYGALGALVVFNIYWPRRK